MKTQIDNRSLLSLPANLVVWWSASCAFMTSYDYTSFSSTQKAVPFTYSPAVYENLIYIFVLHMHDLLPERKRLIKTQPEKLLICICLSGMRSEHRLLPPVRRRARIPKGAITLVCPFFFYGGFKPRTGGCNLLLYFIYSHSLAIKGKIYDLLFN